MRADDASASGGAVLAGAGERSDRVGRQLLRDSGLSAADYALLARLSEAPEGLLRAKELGAEVDWERSRLSHQISRMEKRGLVARESCA
ncbi:MarR family winged helix-turn-helix transcriptional regulator [Streptomyces sp. NPDC059544]|uniref:MarR family winged helix-turn-helix transcriptional regulator n=1 Tax=Streptomyces sp. NPDC059544 TaxID=3346861 RepID=UPI003691CD65